MDDKMGKHSSSVCSDVIDHKKKVSDEDGHVRDIANVPCPPSDGTEGHSEFYSKAPFTLSDDDDSGTEYEDVEKGNKDGNVEKGNKDGNVEKGNKDGNVEKGNKDGNVEKRKNDHAEKNEGHVEKKHKIKLFVDSSSDEDSDNNRRFNRFSKNRKYDDVPSKTYESNDEEEHAFSQTSQLCMVTKTFGRKKPAERG